MRATPLKSDLERDQYRFYEGVEYKHFWDGLKRSKLDELEHAIVRELLPVSGRRIIDVGCGYGRLADCYLNRFPGGHGGCFYVAAPPGSREGEGSSYLRCS